MAQPASPGSKPPPLLEDQEWYHGYRSRSEAISLIREPGDFLVRATDDGPSAEIIISCCDDTRQIVNFILRMDSGTWFLRQKSSAVVAPHRRKFAHAVELVEHYRVRPPSKRIRLARAIPRPEWALKNDYVIYTEEDRIGAGSHGLVYKGLLAKRTGEITVAIKIPLVAAVASEADSDKVKEARAAMLNETKAMAFLAHSNVVQLFGVAADYSPVLVVSEWCVGGDLLAHLIKYGKATDDREKLVYLFEAAAGLLHLHWKKLTHGSLSARNCLISAQGIVKIGDYGVAQLIDEGALAPVRWMPPEALPPAYSARHADIWAFGVLTHEVFTNGATPWCDVPARQVAGRIREAGKVAPALPGTMPAAVGEMVKRMWTAAPEQRPTMRAIARELSEIVNTAMKEKGPLALDKMTVNSIPGVNRTVQIEFDVLSDYEETSAESVDKSKSKKKKEKKK